MLDKSKNYGTVCGHKHAVYYQNGKHFNAQGEEIQFETGKVIEEQTEESVVPVITPAPDPITAPIFTAPETTGVDQTAQTTGIDVENVVDLNGLPWQTIKKRVEGSGGVWSNKEQGIAYLRGME